MKQKIVKNLRFGAILLLAVLLAIVIPVSAVRGAINSNPVEILAELTGKTVSELVADHFDSQKTFGEMATDAGVLEQFQTSLAELRHNRISGAVASGELTQEQANQVITRIHKNQALCDGTGMADDLKQFGRGFGQSQGLMSGQGFGHRKWNGNRNQMRNNWMDNCLGNKGMGQGFQNHGKGSW